MLVYAYDHGGATEAGIVAVIQLVPAAILGPLLSVLADREPPAQLAPARLPRPVGADGAGRRGPDRRRAPAISSTPSPPSPRRAMTITRPAQTALVPHPRPAARGADRLERRLRLDRERRHADRTRRRRRAARDRRPGLGLRGHGRVDARLVAARRAARHAAARRGRRRGRERRPSRARSRRASSPPASASCARSGRRGCSCSCSATQFAAIGALDVITVVVALSVLDLGQGGSGYLNAAFGLGGVLAILLTATFVGSKRLIPWLIAAALAWGGRVPRPRPAADGGRRRAPADRGRRRLHALRRRRPDAPAALRACRHRLAHLRPASKASRRLGLAAGSLLVPVLVSVLGTKAAVIGTGAVLPMRPPALRQGALRGRRARRPCRSWRSRCSARVPFLQPLPAPTVESLARSLIPIDAEPGDVLIAEGDVGDRFYVIAEGEVEAPPAGRELGRLGRGDGFGEIALLQDVPRTATCTAVGRVRLYALEREPFLAAVSGHRRSTPRRAARLVDRRLANTPAAAPAAEAARARTRRARRSRRCRRRRRARSASGVPSTRA